MIKKRWQIPREPDIFIKVSQVKNDLKESTISKTILYMIRYAYDHLYKDK